MFTQKARSLFVVGVAASDNAQVLKVFPPVMFPAVPVTVTPPTVIVQVLTRVLVALSEAAPNAHTVSTKGAVVLWTAAQLNPYGAATAQTTPPFDMFQAQA